MKKAILLSTDRILWIDIYKGILILLVVIGHSTGAFNGYIYQFHMPAFFFISGYLFHISSKGLFSTITEKLYTLLLPLISAIIAISFCFYILIFTGTYYFAFSESFGGIKSSICTFLKNGTTYPLLGATWFLIALLGIFVFNKFLYLLCAKNYIFYFIFILIFYGLGYSMASKGGSYFYFFSIDLIFIGQFFFSVGVLCQVLTNSAFSTIHFKNYMWKNLLWISLHLFLFNLFKTHGIFVEYPSRHFAHIILDSVAAFNGILFCYRLSLLLSKLPINRIFYWIGRNTLGILLFHFCFFKIVFVILAFLNIIPSQDVLNLIPVSSSKGSILWPLFFLVAIIGSIILWRILLYFPITSALFGENRSFQKALINQSNKLTYSIKIMRIAKPFWLIYAKYCTLLNEIIEIFLKSNEVNRK